MKILTTARDIRAALRKLEPTLIAVAYVGAGWDKYASPKHLREIVLSPTLGSNPKAIEDLMRVLGDENVYFLDRLHAKIYLGNDAALLGSCNLSSNGIADNGLREAAIVLTQKGARHELAVQIERYKSKARSLYPTREAKLDRLQILNRQSNDAQSRGFTDSPKVESPLVEHYDSALDRIHICWYQPTSLELNEDRLHKIVGDAGTADSYFSDYMQFRKNDKVHAGDWLLCWQCKNDGMPRKNGFISWMYAHHVVKDGVKDDDEPKLVGQAAPKFLNVPSPPFALDAVTQESIRELLRSRRFQALLSTDEDVWLLEPADKVTPNFIDALKEAVRSKR